MSFQTLQNNVSDGKIGGMTNTHDIVIPRAELPNTTLKFSVNSLDTSVHVEGSTVRVAFCEASSKNARRTALAYLAAAEAIDMMLAEKAKAEDEKKLDAEALVLHNALHDQKSEQWSSGDSYAKKYWRNVAKAARELHGK